MYKSANNKSSCLQRTRKFFTWLFQISLWIGLLPLILFKLNEDNYNFCLVVFIISYIAHFIFQFFSPTFMYLSNFSNADNIHKAMKVIFFSPLEIVWSVECYHYITIRKKEYDNQTGNNTTKKKSKKVVTFKGTKNFHYYSWKDVSGIFLLDSAKVLRSSEEIKFIKLNLNLEYKFHDQDTENDYNYQKSSFFNSNRYRDTQMDTHEKIEVTGLNEYNLIKLADDVPPMFGYWWFIVFTFVLPVAQFYKVYIHKFCCSQEFTVKKEISTRVNLNDSRYEKTYKLDAPKLIYHGKETDYYQGENKTFDTEECDFPNPDDLGLTPEQGNDQKQTSQGNDYGNFEDDDLPTASNLGLEESEVNRQAGNHYSNFKKHQD